MFSIRLCIVLMTFIAITPTKILASCPEDVPAPSDFTFVITGNLGIATWYKPDVSEACDLKYYVEYFVNGVLAESVTTTSEFKIFDRVKLCSTLEVKITSINADLETNTSDPPLTRTADSNIAQISGLRIDGDQAVWDVPSYSDECIYAIYLNEKHIVNVTVNEYYLKDIPACSKPELTVIPQHYNGNVGAPISDVVDIEVEILDIYIQDETILTWETSSTNNDDCTFTLQFDDNPSIDVQGNKYDLEKSGLKPCIKHNVIVSYGTKANASTVDIPPGELEDFEVSYNAADEIIATWSEIYEACTILIAIDGGDEETYSNGAEFPQSEFNFCEDHVIAARATYGDFTGTIVRASFRKNIDQIEEFKIEQTELGFEAKWDEDYRRCEVSLKIADESISEQTGSYYFLGDLDVNFCQTHTATLQIEEIDYGGEPVETEFSRTLGDISDVKLDYSDDGETTVTWGDDIKECNVDITINDVSVLAETTSDTTAKLDTSNLKYCVLNNAKLIASADDTDFKREKDFDITIAGTLEDFDVAPNDAGELVASWSDNFADCTVEVDIDGLKMSLTKDNSILTGFSPLPCVFNTIIAYSIIDDDNQGAPVTAHYTKDTTIEETGFDFHTNQYIYANWLDDFDSCMFELIVLPEYTVMENIVKQQPLDISYCTSHPMILRIMSEVAEEMYEEIDTDMITRTFELEDEFDIIDDIALKLDGEDVTVSLQVTNVDQCNLSYNLQCTNDDQNLEKNTIETENTFECTVDVSITFYTMVITPKYGVIDGAPIECNYDVVYDGNVIYLKLTDPNVLAPNHAKCPEQSN